MRPKTRDCNQLETHRLGDAFMFDQNSAFSMLQDSLDGLARAGTIDKPIEIQPTTQILGPESSLDSMGFVTFVTDIVI